MFIRNCWYVAAMPDEVGRQARIEAEAGAHGVAAE